MIDYHLHLPRSIYEEMIAHARAELPNECVGICSGRVEEAGIIARVQRRFALVNERSSPKEYHAVPFAADRAIRELGHRYLVIYHSHPTSEPIPSRTDLERNFYHETIHMIISMKHEPPLVRAWWMTNSEYREAQWEIVDG